VLTGIPSIPCGSVAGAATALLPGLLPTGEKAPSLFATPGQNLIWTWYRPNPDNGWGLYSSSTQDGAFTLAGAVLGPVRQVTGTAGLWFYVEGIGVSGHPGTERSNKVQCLS